MRVWQAFDSSGAKAAVKYVCGDTQIHPHVDQNPDSLDIIIISLPSRWSSSLRALLPPPQEMPATASVCTKTNRCSGARTHNTTTRHRIRADTSGFGVHDASITRQKAQSGTKDVERCRGIDGIASVGFASRESSCLAGLPWLGCPVQRGGGCVWYVCGSQRSDTQTFSFPTCPSVNQQLSSLPTQAQWRTVMK